MVNLSGSLLSPSSAASAEFGHLMKEAYRAVKVAAKDCDLVVRCHGEVALDWIGQVARVLLMPQESAQNGYLHNMLKIV